MKKMNETRATFIVNEELLEKFKLMAYWDRLLIKDAIDIAIQDMIIKYEKKNGKLKEIPEKRKITMQEIADKFELDINQMELI